MSSMKLWRGQPDHDHWKAKFTPRERAMLWWSLGAVSWVMAWIRWAHPSQPPFTGKLGWLMAWSYANLGPKGPALVFLGTGAACLMVGVFAFRKSPR